MSVFRTACAAAFFALASIGILHPLSAQPAPASHAAVARFFVDIEGIETDYPAKAGGLIPRAVEIKQTARDVKEAYDTLTHPEGSAVKIVLDSMYAAVVAGLTDGFGYHVLSVDTLRGAVPYLLGYPMGTAAKVAPEHAFERVLDVSIDVTVPDATTSSWSFIGTGKAKAKGRPEMRMSVRVVDGAGQTVWRDRVRVRSKERVELSERYVLGVRTEQQRPDASSLPDLTRAAMDKLVQKYRADA